VGKKIAVSKIIIEVKNPHDITPEEAEELAEAVRASYPKYKVRVEGTGYTGYAVTLYEVLRIWLLTTVGTKIVEQLTKLAIEWARQRFNRQGKKPRTTSISIYGPNGEVLRSVVLKNATDEPEDDTAKGFNMKPPFTS
jgi:hypothetical protein